MANRKGVVVHSITEIVYFNNPPFRLHLPAKFYIVMPIFTRSSHSNLKKPMSIEKPLTQFATPEEKARFVRHMFDRISPRYDLMNRLMTLGQDVRWRRLAIQKAELPPAGRLLDIACGTGDLARTGLKQDPSLVVGADFSRKMLELAASKHRRFDRIAFVAADGLRMPFSSNSFDAAVTGFSMRNVTDIQGFIAEMARVVKPGGKVVVLEITPFNRPVLRPLFQFYFRKIVPLLGALIAGEKEAYTYLPQSVDIFLKPEALKQRMEDAGLSRVQYTLLSLGTVALHWGWVDTA
ncbi:MAG: ubiquinone/menaquinone biosynthesis methyltransferase [Calditrichaeota bacterium]|nr:MAG: ubiquinone/menaquinone biosynthesis methyltransferase [Calditrichota bacterium]